MSNYELKTQLIPKRRTEIKFYERKIRDTTMCPWRKRRILLFRSKAPSSFIICELFVFSDIQLRILKSIDSCWLHRVWCWSGRKPTGVGWDRGLGMERERVVFYRVVGGVLWEGETSLSRCNESEFWLILRLVQTAQEADGAGVEDRMKKERCRYIIEDSK